VAGLRRPVRDEYVADVSRSWSPTYGGGRSGGPGHPCRGWSHPPGLGGIPRGGQSVRGNPVLWPASAEKSGAFFHDRREREPAASVGPWGKNTLFPVPASTRQSLSTATALKPTDQWTATFFAELARDAGYSSDRDGPRGHRQARGCGDEAHPRRGWGGPPPRLDRVWGRATKKAAERPEALARAVISAFGQLQPPPPAGHRRAAGLRRGPAFHH